MHERCVEKGCRRVQIFALHLFHSQQLCMMAAAMTAKALLPVLFVTHGAGPCYFLDRKFAPSFAEIDRNSQAADFLRSIPSLLPSRPEKILVVSAHWEEDVVTISRNSPSEPIMYDYYGFPKESYAPHVTYNCKSDDGLIRRVGELLSGSGIRYETTTRPFDHGVFVPLKLAFPDADVPIVQVSLKIGLDPEEHVKLGEALSPLRSEGVFIVCSGSATHTFEKSPQDAVRVPQFTNWLKDRLESLSPETRAGVRQSIARIMSEAPHARACHPRIEHLVPLHVAVGAALSGVTEGRQIWHPRSQHSASFCSRVYDQTVWGFLALDSYMFW